MQQLGAFVAQWPFHTLVPLRREMLHGRSSRSLEPLLSLQPQLPWLDGWAMLSSSCLATLICTRLT